MFLDSTHFHFINSLPKPIAIVGMGISGHATLRLLKLAFANNNNPIFSTASGMHLKDPPNIVTFDAKDSSAQISDPNVLIKDYKPKTLVVSPGVPLSTQWIQDFIKSGGKITSELEIAFSFLSSEKAIGITGSVGKSTTTALIGAGASAASNNSFVGGNFGFPLADYVSSLLEGRRDARAQWVILELSSYQLENFNNLVCEYAVLTHFTPNHLERYSSLEEYYQTKLTILDKTKGAVVANRNGGDLHSVLTSIQNSSRNSKQNSRQHKSIKVMWADRSSNIINQHNLKSSKLIGEYNQDNLAVAATIAELASWPENSFRAMQNFAGLPHRLENLGEKNGVSFINDSKATTIDSVLEAVNTILPNKKYSRIILLLGGHDKNLPWQKLQNLHGEKKIQPVFFGEFGAQAHKITNLSGPIFPTLNETLENLVDLIQKNDVVLLSPGGTSHDEFKNFEERGNYFRKWVENFTN